MAQTNAQRQATYRKRHSDSHDTDNHLARINTLVSFAVKTALSAMAARMAATSPLPGLRPAGLPDSPAFQRPGRFFFDSVILAYLLL